MSTWMQIAGDVRMGELARGLIAPQTVAISTRSSLASLPAMLASSRAMGIRDEVSDVTLPIAVALFRATGPAMNVAVAFYVAHWLGLQPTLAQMIAATAVGAVMSYGAVSLPGEVSYISSIAPIALALGVPIAPHFAMELHLHLAAAQPRETWVEHFDWLEPLFNERLELRDGRMLIPNRPGLGLTLSEQAASWRVGEAEAVE